MGKSTINGPFQYLFVCLPEGKSHETHIDQWPVLNPQGLTALATIYPEVRTFVLMTPFKFLEFQSWTGHIRPCSSFVPNSGGFWPVSLSNLYETSPLKQRTVAFLLEMATFLGSMFQSAHIPQEARPKASVMTYVSNPGHWTCQKARNQGYWAMHR